MDKAQIKEHLLEDRDERLSRMRESMRHVINSQEWSEESKVKLEDVFWTVAENAFTEGEKFALKQLDLLCKKEVARVVHSAPYIKMTLFMISASIFSVVFILIYQIMSRL